jgi:tetratricopeptide (TPR) repeat protein
LNLKDARKTVEESLRLWRELGDKWWAAVALELVGLIMAMEGDIQTALARDEEGVSLAREVDDPWPLALCLIRLGDDLKVKGTDIAAARLLLEEGVAVARKAGDKSVLSEGLRELGSAYYAEGRLAEAASVIEEALAEARAIGSIIHVVLALIELVSISCLQNDPVKAKGYCFELWALARDIGAPMANGLALLAFGLAASFGGETGKGVRLLRALEVVFGQHNVKLTNVEGSPLVKVYKQALERAQAQLGPAAFEAAWAEGQQMTMEQAIALATETESEDSQLPKSGPSSD